MLYYDPSKNPEGASLDGVPLRDLTDDDLAALPRWLLASVEACGFYTTEAPPAPVAEPAVLGELVGVEVPAGDLVADIAAGGQPIADATDAENPAPRRRR